MILWGLWRWSSHVAEPTWLPASWILGIGTIILLLDVIWTILDFEVFLWTPLWEVIGMAGGFIVIVWGFIRLIAAILANETIPIFVALGILILGAGIISGTQGLKDRIGAKIDRIFRDQQ